MIPTPATPRGRVVITGAGAISPFGIGLGPLLEGARSGRTVLTRTDPLGGRGVPGLVALVREEVPPPSFAAGSWRRLDRCSRMAVAAAAEALASAGYEVAAAGSAAAPKGWSSPDRATLGVVLGTMTAGVEPLRVFLTTVLGDGPESASPMLFPFTVPNAPASQCSILLGLRGPNLTLCQMEASGLGAVAAGATLIRGGAADVVLAGGVDEHPKVIGRAWRGLRITARGEPESFRGPFDRGRRGFVPGEGAYVVLLESLERARSRGAFLWAEVAGSAQAHAQGAAHRWPDAPAEPARAIREALSRAGLPAGDRAAEGLGYVAAGANGSRRLDAVEARSLTEAFGAGIRRVPVTAIKGAIGESGAASAGAALLAALSIRDGFIPPIAGLVDPEEGYGLSLVLRAPRREPVPAVLVHAVGTGGSCVSLVLSRPRL